MIGKTLGAVFIVLSAFLLGEQQAARLRRRVAQLAEFRLALKLLAAEIGYTATPLPLALRGITARLRRPDVVLFFQEAASALGEEGIPDAEAAWSKAAERARRKLELSGEDWAAVHRAAAGLGGLGRESQVKQLEMAELELARLMTEAAAGCREKEKMWRYLGVLSGMALVILLY